MIIKKIIDWIDKNPRDPVLEIIDNKLPDGDSEIVQDVFSTHKYSARWTWYHTILAVELFFTNLLLFSILVLLAVKL
jgi:hypothetical protein